MGAFTLARARWPKIASYFDFILYTKLLTVILIYIRDRYSTSFHLEEEKTETELGMCIY